MKIDFNILESEITRLKSLKQYDDAKAIYHWMIEQDMTVDSGMPLHGLGEIYELEGQIMAAKFWYALALEQMPGYVHYVNSYNNVKDYIPPSIKLAKKNYP